MLQEAPLEQACHRRYPAWTLYARALSGNRLDAEAIVRRAVARTQRAPVAPSSEREAHRLVLGSIRKSALPPIEIPRDETVLSRLGELSRWQRRAIDLVLRKRPALSLRQAALKLGTSTSALEGAIERALHKLSGKASRDPTGPDHPDLDRLLTYVSGALSGDEARSVVAHCRSCFACADRLGAMIVLKSSAAESARVPRLSRSHQRAGLGLLGAGATLGMFLLVEALLPNPWAEHATRETVPRWFHEFFYGERRTEAAGDTARGLELLVEGELEEAIRTLEPLASDDPEAAAYLGIARYLTGSSSRRTVKLLEEGTSSTRAGRLSRWYLASVLLTRRDVDGAKEQLEALASVGDWFGRAAQELLEELDEASDSLTAG